MSKNILYTGDNLYIMHGMNSESVDLIYLDPPFNSKRTHAAPIGSKAAGVSFKDMWSWNDVDEAYLDSMVDGYAHLVQFIEAIRSIHGEAMMAYCTYMTQRIIEMHRVLKPTGSLYLHCDQTASHYLKIILDRIFGMKHFRNEIIWSYQGKWTNASNFLKKTRCYFVLQKTKELKLFLVETKSQRQPIERGFVKKVKIWHEGRLNFLYSKEKVKTC